VAGRGAVAIRAMTVRDVRAATAIERAAYGPQAPHSEFRRELQNGLAQYLVAEPVASPASRSTGARSRLRPLRLLRRWPPWRTRSGPALVGFAGVWFTRDQLHLVTIAVDPGWQRRGVAALLLLRCVELAEEAGLSSIALEVRPANTGARALYERFGLREVGRLRRYYSDTGEDAVLMLSPPFDDPAFRERIGGLRAELTRAAGAGARGDEGRRRADDGDGGAG
jgi:ribosomal-protein-alanine acetyltransferase